MSETTGQGMAKLHEAFKSEAAGQDAQGLDQALAALEAFTNAKDRTGSAAAHHLAGVLYARLVKLREALAHLDSALPLRESTGDQEGLAALQQQRFEVALAAKDENLAQEAAQSLVELMSKAGSREGEARALHQLAQLALATGDQSRAAGLVQRGLELAEELEDAQAKSAFMGLQSQLQGGGGLSQAEAALATARKAGSRSAVVGALRTLADQAAGDGDLSRSLSLLEEALDGVELLQDVPQRAHLLMQIATVELSMGHKTQAMDRLLYAGRSFEELADLASQMEANHSAGELAMELGRVPQALSLGLSQVHLCEKLGDPASLGAALFVYGQRLIVSGDLEQSAQAFAKAAEAQEEAGQSEARGITLGMQGQVLAALGHVQGALEVLTQGERLLQSVNSASLVDLQGLLTEVRSL